MDEYESLSHSKWECKYRVIFIPKCRRKTLYKELRQHLGEVFRRLAEQKQSRIEEGRRIRSHAERTCSRHNSSHRAISRSFSSFE